LRLADASVGYLNSSAAGVADGAGCGEVLVALTDLQAKLTAARAGFLRRFDAADTHDDDGYGASSAWQMARAKLARKDARAAVAQMRLLGARPQLYAGLAAGAISDSWAAQIVK
jgi:hypothetical protein